MMFKCLKNLVFAMVAMFGFGAVLAAGAATLTPVGSAPEQWTMWDPAQATYTQDDAQKRIVVSATKQVGFVYFTKEATLGGTTYQVVLDTIGGSAAFGYMKALNIETGTSVVALKLNESANVRFPELIVADKAAAQKMTVNGTFRNPWYFVRDDGRLDKVTTVSMNVADKATCNPVTYVRTGLNQIWAGYTSIYDTTTTYPESYDLPRAITIVINAEMGNSVVRYDPNGGRLRTSTTSYQSEIQETTASFDGDQNWAKTGHYPVRDKATFKDWDVKFSYTLKADNTISYLHTFTAQWEVVPEYIVDGVSHGSIDAAVEAAKNSDSAVEFPKAESSSTTIPEAVKEVAVKVEVSAGTVAFDKTASAAAAGATLNIVESDEKVEGAVSVYEITLVKGDAHVSELGGTATVTLPVPAALEGKKVAVFFVADDGTKTAMENIVVADGKVSFTTTHFSTYSIEADESVASVTDAYGNATTYTSLQAAIDAAAKIEEPVIDILGDISVDVWNQVWNASGWTVNGNNHTITVGKVDGNMNGDFLFYRAIDLTVRDLTIVIKDYGNGFDMGSGLLTNVELQGGANSTIGVFVDENGTVTVDGCRITGFKTYGVAGENTANASDIVVRNTTISGSAVSILSFAANTTIETSTINGGEISLAAGYNSAVTEPTYIVTGNKMAGGAKVDLHVAQLDKVTFTGNEVETGTTVNVTEGSTGNLVLGGNTWADALNQVTAPEGFNVVVKDDDIVVNGPVLCATVSVGETISEKMTLSAALEKAKVTSGDVVITITGEVDLSKWESVNMNASFNSLTIEGENAVIEGLAKPLFSNFGRPLTMKNITFKDVALSESSSGGVTGSGVITAGTSGAWVSEFENVVVDGGTIHSSSKYAGGFIAYYQGVGGGSLTIKNCCVRNVTIESSSNDSIGGLVGHMDQCPSVTVVDTVIGSVTLKSTRADKSGIAFGTINNKSDVELGVITDGACFLGEAQLFKVAGRKSGDSTLTIVGGAYDSNPQTVGVDTSSLYQIVSTTANEEISIAVDGKIIEKDDKFVVAKAQIGETLYTTIQEAVNAAATAGQTITVIGNVRELGTEVEPNSGEFFIQILNKDITLDLGGKTVNGSFYLNAGSKAKFMNGTILNLAGNKSSGIESVGGNIVLADNMVMTNSVRHTIRVKGGTAVIEGGTYAATGNSTYHVVNVSHESTVTIAGGVFSGNKGNSTAGGNALMIQDAASKVNVSGGTFKNASGVEGCICAAAGLSISGGTYDTWTYDEYLSTDKRYVAVKNAEEMYEVVEATNWIQVADVKWYTDGADAFTLTTAEQLAGVAKLVNEGKTFANKTITLGENIVLDGLVWPGIGVHSKTRGQGMAFKGLFNGNNKKITGLMFENENYNGFFNQVDGATVKDLTIQGNITLMSGGGAFFAGSSHGATFENCMAEGSFVATHNLGGIVTYLSSDSTLSKCVNNAALTNSEANGTKLGGMAASCEGNTAIGSRILNCVNNGTLTFSAETISDAEGGLGGLVGYAHHNKFGGYLTIKDSSNTGTLSAPQGARIGQLVGGLYCTAVIDGTNQGLDDTLAAGINNVAGLCFATVANDVATYTVALEAGNTYLVTAKDAKPVVQLAAGESITFDQTLAKIDASAIRAAATDGVIIPPAADATVVTYMSAVAKIGEMGYASIAEAVEAANSGDTITVLSATVAWEGVTVKEGVVFKQGTGVTDPSAPADYKWVGGELVAKNYVARVGDAKYETLGEAMDEAGGEMVTLLADITISEKTYVKSSLDLAGKTITVNSNGDGLYVRSAATISNGKIVANTPNGQAIVVSSDTILDNMVIEGDSKDGLVRVINSAGNLVINANTTIKATGTNIAVSFTGGGDVEINGTVTAVGSAVSTSDNTSGNLTINEGAEISGATAIYVNGGKVNVTGGTIIGALQEIQEDGLVISGGAFSAVVDQKYCAEGYIPVTEAGADGMYGVEWNTNVTAVAQVGTTQYTTLQAAIDAANGAEIKLVNSVTENVTTDKAFVLNLNEKTVNGYFFLTGAATIMNGAIDCAVSGKSAIEVSQNCKLTVDALTITSKRHAIRVDGGELTVNGGTYTTIGNAGAADTCHAINAGGGDYGYAKVTINDGTFNGLGASDAVETADSGCAITAQTGATISINGGIFNGKNRETLGNNYGGAYTLYGGTYDKDPRVAGATVAEGYVTVPADSLFKVVKADIDAFKALLLASKDANGNYVFDGQGQTFSWTIQEGIRNGEANAPSRYNSRNAQYYLLSGETGAVTLENVNFVFTAPTADPIGGNITGNNTKVNAAQLYFQNTGDFTVSGCTFNKVLLTNFSGEGNASVTGCTFTDCDDSYAIKDIRGKNITVQGNTFENCSGAVMVSAVSKDFAIESVSITDNTFYKVGADEKDRGIVQFASSGVYAANAITYSGNTETDSGADFRQLNMSADEQVQVLVAAGATLTKDSKVYVAKIGATRYETLQEALAAANGGVTVTLLADVSVEGFTLDKAITLDTNGKTLTVTTPSAEGSTAAIVLAAEKNIAIAGTGKIMLSADNAATVLVQSAANLTLGGTVLSASGRTALEITGGTSTLNESDLQSAKVGLHMTGGTVTYNVGGSLFFSSDYVIDGGTLDLNGGYLVSEGGTMSIAEGASVDIADVKTAAITFENGLSDISRCVNGDKPIYALVNSVAYVPVGNETYKYSLKVNNNTFLASSLTTFLDANGAWDYLTLAGEGAVVTLVADDSINYTITRDVTLDLDGKNYTGTMTVASDVVLTLQNETAENPIQVVAAAKIGSVYYGSFQAAIEVAEADQTVTILSNDVTWPDSFALEDGVTIVRGSGVTLDPPDGYTWDENGNLVKVYVAQIDETKYATLQEAIAAAAADQTVTLLANLAVAETVTIDKAITLDLNDKTISAAEGVYLRYLLNVGNVVVIENGTVTTAMTQQPDNGPIYPAAIGVTGQLTLNGVTVNGCHGVNVGCYQDYTSPVAEGASAVLNDCTINVNERAVITQTTGKIEINNTKMVVAENQNFGIYMANGTVDFNADSELLAQTVGVVMNSDSVFNMNGGLVSAEGHGFEIYGGALNVTGGEITTIGETDDVSDADTVVALEVDGFCNTNDGNASTLTMTGGRLSSLDPNAPIIETGNNETGKGYVSGGTFSGTFDESFLADGYELKDNGDGMYTVVEDKSVASVTAPDGTVTKYTDVVSAIKAVMYGGNSPAGDYTITLLKDCTSSMCMTANGPVQNVTLDLNGKTLTIPTYFHVGYGDTLIVKDSSAEQTGKIVCTQNGAITAASGNLILESGTVTHDENFPAGYAPISQVGSAEIIINGGKVAVDETHRAITSDKAGVMGGRIVINNGEVTGSVLLRANTGVETIEFNGGKLDVALELPNGYAGTVTKAANVTVDAPADYRWIEQDDGTQKLTAISYVAELTDKNGNVTKFESFNDAYKTASNNGGGTQTIKLLDNGVYSLNGLSWTGGSANLTLDLNGHDLTLEKSMMLPGTFYGGNTLTIDDKSKDADGQIVFAEDSYIEFFSDGSDTLIVNGGTFVKDSGSKAAIVDGSWGTVNHTVTFNGGNFDQVAGDVFDMDKGDNVTKANDVDVPAPEGYEWDEEGKLVVGYQEPVCATIEGQSKMTLSAALAYAKENADTVITLDEGATIDLSRWTAVDMDGVAFTLDGNGATITGLKSALFESATTGGHKVVVENLTISGATNAGAQSSHSSYVNAGALFNVVGYCDITLSNVKVVGSEIGGENTYYAGGLIGYVAATAESVLNVVDCSVTGTTLTSTSSVGGLFGHSNGGLTTITGTEVGGNTLKGASAEKEGVLIGTLTSNVGTKIDVVETDKSTGTGTLNVIGRVYTGVTYTDGEYFTDPRTASATNENTAILIEDLIEVKDGKYFVLPAVAQVGETKYPTLQKAVNAVESAEDVVTLLKDTSETGVKIAATQTVVVNMAEKTLTGDILSEGNLTITNGTINSTTFTSAIESKGEGAVLLVEDLNVTSQRHALRIEGGTATVRGGTYETVGASGKTSHALNAGGEYRTIVLVENGTFIGPRGNGESDSGAAVNAQNGATVTIADGIFRGGKNNTLAVSGTGVINPLKAGLYDQDQAKRVAFGYKTVQEGEMWRVVKCPGIDDFRKALSASRDAETGDYCFDGKGETYIWTLGNEVNRDDANAPSRYNTNNAQYYLLSGETGSVTMKNVEFVFKAPEGNVTGDIVGAGGLVKNAQLYFMNTGDFTVTGCTFDGVILTNFEGKDGTASVTGCTFENVKDGYAIKDIRGETIMVKDNTFTDCGAGIMVSAKDATDNIDNVTITGNTFEDVGKYSNDADRGFVQFAGNGVYADDAIVYEENTVKGTNNGSTFWQLNVSAAEQVQWMVDNAENNYTLANGSQQVTWVAQIDGTKYATIQNAVNAATAGQTVTLLKNVAESGIKVASDDVIVLDLGGFTLTGDILSVGALTVLNGAIVSDTFVSAIESKGASAELTLTETEGAPLSLTSQRHAVRIEGGTATINGGTYTATGRKGQGETVHAVNAGGDFETTVTINGGTFNGIKYNGNAETPDSGAAVNAQNNATVTIEDGTFAYGQNETLRGSGTGKIVLKGGCYDQDPTGFCADGYWAFQKFNTKNFFFVAKKKDPPVATVEIVEPNPEVTVTVDGGDMTLPLEKTFKFTAPDANQAAANESQYGAWHADFVVSVDKDIPANSIVLAGKYGSYGWIAFTNADMPVKAGEKIRLLKTVGPTMGHKYPYMSYAELCSLVREFQCGVADVNNTLAGVTFTVELQMFPIEPCTNDNDSWNVEKENAEPIVVKTVDGAGNPISTSHTLLSVTVNVAAVGGGDVSGVPTTGVNVGDTFTLTAVAKDGNTFAGWTGDYTALTTEITVTVAGDVNLTANFLPAGLYTEMTNTVVDAYKAENELVSVEDIVNLSLQYPTIQVGKDEDGNQVADVGIKLMKATTLKDETTGKPNWTPVVKDEPVEAFWAEDGATMIIRLPADKKAQFFRFVPVNGLTPPPPVVSTPDDLKTELANPETTKVEVSGGTYADPVSVPKGKEVVVKDGTFAPPEYNVAIDASENSTVVLNGGDYTVSEQMQVVNAQSAGSKVTINKGTYTGDIAVWVNADAQVTINGGTFNVWALAMCDTSSSTANVTITGGTFNLETFMPSAQINLVITGGVFNMDPSKYVPDTHKVTEANGVWTVTAG